VKLFHIAKVFPRISLTHHFSHKKFLLPGKFFELFEHEIEVDKPESNVYSYDLSNLPLPPPPYPPLPPPPPPWKLPGELKLLDGGGPSKLPGGGGKLLNPPAGGGGLGGGMPGFGGLGVENSPPGGGGPLGG
jgi:hypothetical protein